MHHPLARTAIVVSVFAWCATQAVASRWYEPPRCMTAKEAAHAVVRAIREGDGDRLRELAGKDGPDPWLVADELCGRGAYDAAEAFARATPRLAVERLPRYVALQRATEPDRRTRQTLVVAEAALEKEDWARAIASAEEMNGRLDSVVRIRVAFGAVYALAALGRTEEGVGPLRRIQAAAEVLGWLSCAADPRTPAEPSSTTWAISTRR